MKQKVVLLGLLFVGVNVLAAPTEFQFVSTLSAPAASFREVETRGDKPVEVSNGAEMNIGSGAASQGTIALYDKALEVGHLYMENNTTLQLEDGKNWIVEQLYIGADGSVSPKDLRVSTLNVGDAQHANTSLTLDTATLTARGNVFAETVRVTGKLDVDSDNSDGEFLFSGGVDEPAEATFFNTPIAKTKAETNVGHDLETIRAILRTGN